MHDSTDLHDDLLQVIKAASQDSAQTVDHMRCSLYQDDQGRIFNIAISGGSAQFGGTWQSSLLSFSGLQATAALMVLSRSFACFGTCPCFVFA